MRHVRVHAPDQMYNALAQVVVSRQLASDASWLCHGPARRGSSCFVRERSTKHANPRRYRVRGLTLTQLADLLGRGLKRSVAFTGVGAAQDRSGPAAAHDRWPIAQSQ